MTTDPRSIVVSAPMLREHLSYLTVGYFDVEDEPPPLLEGYAECAAHVRGSAERSGDLPWFTLGLQHILLDPAIDARSLNPDGYSFSDEDLRDIFAYLLRTLAPGEALDPNGPAARVSLAELSEPQWLALRQDQAR